MAITRTVKLLMTLVFIISIVLTTYAQEKRTHSKKSKASTTQNDTIQVSSGQLIIFADTLIVPPNDTILIVPQNKKVRIKKNPYRQSDRFYDSLKSKSYRYLITKKLYDLLIPGSTDSNTDIVNFEQSKKLYQQYEGYTISMVHIRRLKVLEGNVMDTTLTIQSGLSRAANSIHVDTKDRIIRRSLLFKPGNTLSSYQLADNERILRQLPFIQDARITAKPVAGVDSLVDVHVVTQDRLSIIFGADVNDIDEFDLKIGERNFLGTGNELSFEYKYGGENNSESGYELNFIDRNVRGTFITNRITLSDLSEKKGYEFIFNRDFITPDTKWAGGVEIGALEQVRKQEIESENAVTEAIEIPYKRNFQDLWAGYLFRLGNQTGRKNITISSRWYRQDFSMRPVVNKDTNQFFHDRQLVLAELAFNKINYFKSNRIRVLGLTEDIPLGFTFAVTYGHEYGEFRNLPYGAISAGTAYWWEHIGFLGLNSAIGGFIDNNTLIQGAINLQGIYFTPLLKTGHKQLRQFLTWNYVTGLDRVVDKNVNLNEVIQGADEDLKGSQRLGIQLETALYNPTRLYGFQVASFLFYDLGWISTQGGLFEQSKFYSAIGLGVRLRNESLIFQTIQISLAYLPQASSFNLDFSASDQLFFRSFQSIKPEVVAFE